MVELDVQMTRDHQLVVFHDDRLERTTNGTGQLTKIRYAQLAKLDAGSWFHPRFAGERVLLLSQAVRLVPKRMWINLELKRTSRSGALLVRLLRLIRHQEIGSRLLLSSFEARLLRPFGATHLSTALLCRRQPVQSLERAIRLRCAAWHPFHALITPQRIARAHAANLRVHVWTVDDPKRARQLIRWGADGVFTNDPGRLVRHLRRLADNQVVVMIPPAAPAARRRTQQVVG